MRMGLDLFEAETPELCADHFQFVIKARGPDGQICSLILHQVHKAHPCGLCIALLAKRGDGGDHHRTHVVL